MIVNGNNYMNDLKKSLKDQMGDDLEGVAISLLKEDFNIDSFQFSQGSGVWSKENTVRMILRNGKQVSITIQG